MARVRRTRPIVPLGAAAALVVPLVLVGFGARVWPRAHELVAVSLADRVREAHFGFVTKVPVEAPYDATLSPSTFTLVNDCDFDHAGLVPQDSEPVILWGEDRGQEATGELSIRAYNSRGIYALVGGALTVTATSVCGPGRTGTRSCSPRTCRRPPWARI